MVIFELLFCIEYGMVINELLLCREYGMAIILQLDWHVEDRLW